MTPIQHLKTGAGIEISVVVATFDRPTSLSRCLETLLIQQTSRSFEIIVVDNHPQSHLTEALVQDFPTVRWIQEPVAGLSRARNKGIRASAGTVIVTTDDDVIAVPGWLERLTGPLFDGTCDLAATTGNCLPWKAETEAETVFERYGGLRHGASVADFDAQWLAKWRIFFPQLWRIGTTANAAFLASLFRNPAIGMFETLLGTGTPAGAWEDLYCFYRILRAGYRIRYLPDAQLLHAHREELAQLKRQLCGYRRGETAFLSLVFIRHRDWRILSQLFVWIPKWRLALLLQELRIRIRGQRRFPLRLMWAESLAYLSGPWALWRSHRMSRHIGRAEVPALFTERP